MSSTPPVPIRAKPPAFSAAIFPPFWETHVAHFWVVAGVTQAIRKAAIHMLSISQKPVFEPVTGERRTRRFEGIITLFEATEGRQTTSLRRSMCCQSHLSPPP